MCVCVCVCVLNSIGMNYLSLPSSLPNASEATIYDVWEVSWCFVFCVCLFRVILEEGDNSIFVQTQIVYQNTFALF